MCFHARPFFRMGLSERRSHPEQKNAIQVALGRRGGFTLPNVKQARKSLKWVGFKWKFAWFFLFKCSLSGSQVQPDQIEKNPERIKKLWNLMGGVPPLIYYIIPIGPIGPQCNCPIVLQYLLISRQSFVSWQVGNGSGEINQSGTKINEFGRILINVD